MEGSDLNYSRMCGGWTTETSLIVIVFLASIGKSFDARVLGL